MLVLTRKLQEKIQIGQDITITVLRVKGNTVRVGIDAPRDVRVVRAELPRFESLAEDALVGDGEGIELIVNGSDVEGAAAVESSESSESTPADGPTIGRRFVIRQQRGEFGRPQISAIAAP